MSELKGPVVSPPYASEEEKPKYVLPSLEKGPASFFDPESGSFWVGVPVGGTDPLQAAFVFDSVKLEFLKHWGTFNKPQKVVNPGSIIDRAVHATSKLFKRR